MTINLLAHNRQILAYAVEALSHLTPESRGYEAARNRVKAWEHIVRELEKLHAKEE